MRAKFERNGFEDFAEHEILEYMLFDALPRVNTNDIAHRLLDKFGSLYAVFGGRRKRPLQRSGYGP